MSVNVRRVKRQATEQDRLIMLGSEADVLGALIGLEVFLTSSNPMSVENIPILLKWCAKQGIKVDPRLNLKADNYGGIGVFTGDLGIPRETTGKQQRANQPRIPLT